MSLETDGFVVQKRSIEEILKSQLRNSSNRLSSASSATNLAENENTTTETEPAEKTATSVSPRNLTVSSSAAAFTSASSRNINSNYFNLTPVQNNSKRFKPSYNNNHPRYSSNPSQNLPFSFYQQQQQRQQLVYAMPRYAPPPTNLQLLNPYQAQIYNQMPQIMQAPPPPPIYHTSPYANQPVNYYSSSSNSSYLAQVQSNQQPITSYQTTYAQNNNNNNNNNNNQQQQQQPLQINLNETNIKTEPVEFKGGLNNIPVTSQGKAKPYFTNPLAFKQEPSESNVNETIASAATSTALNLVNHLLKDQQVMSQLEKVAQTFRKN